MPAAKDRLIPLVLLLACAALIGVTFATARAEYQKEDPWTEEEWGEMEQAALSAKLIHRRVETHKGAIEMAGAMTAAAGDDTTTAALAIMALDEQLDDPDDITEFLENQLKTVQDEPTRRLIRLKLAEAYGQAGDADEALDHLGVLIQGKN